MIWFGSKKTKEAITNDGYHLKVKYIEDNKYIWIVHYNEVRLEYIPNKPIFVNNFAKAKRQAIRLMLKHMLKSKTVFKL